MCTSLDTSKQQHTPALRHHTQTHIRVVCVLEHIIDKLRTLLHMNMTPSVFMYIMCILVSRCSCIVLLLGCVFSMSPLLSSPLLLRSPLRTIGTSPSMATHPTPTQTQAQRRLMMTVRSQTQCGRIARAHSSHVNECALLCSSACSTVCVCVFAARCACLLVCVWWCVRLRGVCSRCWSSSGVARIPGVPRALVHPGGARRVRASSRVPNRCRICSMGTSSIRYTQHIKQAQAQAQRTAHTQQQRSACRRGNANI